MADSGAPTVSAVVTTYERPEKVRRAIESVWDQTYDDVQLVVVEDGSDSGVEQWLYRHGSGATYVCHDKNRGLAAARNSGLEHSNGDFVAYLDDDDEWKPRRVEAQVEAWREWADDADLAVVYCPVEVRTPDGEHVTTIQPTNEGNLREAIKVEGALTLSSSCLFDREVLETVGGFDEGLPSGIDHDIWMTLAVHDYAARAIDEPLVISYDSDEADMMTDTAARIYGVRRYVEKWTPTYEAWFGAVEGQRYAREYFADVIGRLAASKASSGQWAEMGQAVCAMCSYCGPSLTMRIVLWRTLVGGTVSRLPDPVSRGLRRVYHSIQD